MQAMARRRRVNIVILDTERREPGLLIGGTPLDEARARELFPTIILVYHENHWMWVRHSAHDLLGTVAPTRASTEGRQALARPRRGGMEAVDDAGGEPAEPSGIEGVAREPPHPPEGARLPEAVRTPG